MKSAYHLSPIEITRMRIKALKTGIGAFPCEQKESPSKITPEMRERIAALTQKTTNNKTYNCIEDALTDMKEEIHPNPAFERMNTAFLKMVERLEEAEKLAQQKLVAKRK